jgi:hypothetical protein
MNIQQAMKTIVYVVIHWEGDSLFIIIIISGGRGEIDVLLTSCKDL